MARFQIDAWLQAYGFRSVGDDWWAFPEGLPYFSLDVVKREEACVIYDYRENPPPTGGAVGQRQVYTREQYEAETGDTTDEDGDCWGHAWIEYRFPWPTTRAEAEAIADAMGWRDPADNPPDTPLDTWAAGVDQLISELPRDHTP